MSLREIAQEVYHNRVTHGDIQRALVGVFPKSVRKRKAFNLHALVESEPCPDCEVVHDLRDQYGNIVCPNKTPVDLVVYELDEKQLARIMEQRQPVRVFVKRNGRPRQPGRKRVRVELPADVSAEDLEAIKSLTPAERLERLVGEK